MPDNPLSIFYISPEFASGNFRIRHIRARTIIGDMPIKIPSGLPARDILDSERIFALEKPEAERQRVRPLKLVVLNR